MSNTLEKYNNLFEFQKIKLFHHKIDVNLEKDKTEILGYVFKIENSLADLRPDVAKKWNYEKKWSIKTRYV